jgi:SMI1 / KNR4 family (SUKH-1)
MDGIGERLKAHWLAQDLQMRPGVLEVRLQQFEAHFAVTLPNDMRDYFLHVNGRELTDNDDLFRFWPIEEVSPMTGDRVYEDVQIAQESSFFIFADYCIFLPAYAIRLESGRTRDHPVIAFSWDDCEKRHDVSIVAVSFSEFAEMYLKDEDSRMDLAFGT